MAGISLDGIPCIDPNEVRDACARDGLPTDWYGLPNRYVCPNGLEPGFGHLLMTKESFGKLQQRPNRKMTLRMQSDWGRKEFPGILFCGTPRQVYGSTNPALLVPITDSRADAVAAGNFRYSWRSSPSTTSGTNQKTWAEAVTHLWTATQTLGPAPTLAGIPGQGLVLEQFDGHGFKTANLLEDVLTGIGCVAAYDPDTGRTGVSYLAGASEGVFAFARDYRNLLVFDEGPLTPTPTLLVPAVLRVLFPVWSEDAATSELAVYAKDITLPTGAGGKVRQVGAAVIQDFQPLRIKSDGTILNAADLDARAAAMAQIYMARLGVNSPVLPVSREYRGFINDPRCKPGPLFDMVAWYSVGDEARTAVLRAGMQGTGELYAVASLPAAGLITTYHQPTILVENGAVLRAGGAAPTPGRTFQNEGWWQENSPRMTRLIGSGLGGYMMRTQSLRYGDWAVMSAGGKGDLRARLYRPWTVEATVNNTPSNLTADNTGFSAPFQAAEAGYIYASYLLVQDPIDPTAWLASDVVYLAGANKEALVVCRKYMAHRAKNALGVPLTYDGSVGPRPVYHTFCCDGGTVASCPAPPPVPTCPASGCTMPGTLYLEINTADWPLSGCTPAAACGLGSGAYTVPLIRVPTVGPTNPYTSTICAVGPPPRQYQYLWRGTWVVPADNLIDLVPAGSVVTYEFLNYAADDCKFDLSGYGVGPVFTEFGCAIFCSDDPVDPKFCLAPSTPFCTTNGCPTPLSKYIGGYGVIPTFNSYALSFPRCRLHFRVRIA